MDKIKVFIVEGNSDDRQLRMVYPNINTIITDGTRFNKPLLERISKVHKFRSHKNKKLIETIKKEMEE